MKIVINCDFGGFSLSDACLLHMGIKFTTVTEEHKHARGHFHTYRKYEDENFRDSSVERTDPRLIRAIEDLGEQVCSGEYACLRVVEIPDNLKHWHIEDYDGCEHINASESEIQQFG